MISGFFAGAFLFGDHEKLLGPGAQGGNYYGIYYGEPSPTSGDQVIADIQLDGAAWASIGVSPNKTLGNVALRKLHLGSCPFGIYKESAAGGQPIMAGAVLSNVSFESCGNGNIFVNGPGGTGADIQNCVFDASPSANALDPGVTIPLSTTDWRGYAIGRMNAPVDLATGQWFCNEVLGADPTYPHPGLTSYSAMVACGMFVGGRFGPAESSIERIVLDGKLFTSGGCSGDAVVMTHGTAARILRANFSSGTMSAGTLAESAGGGQPGCRPSTGTRRAVGVALHGCANGDSVLTAYSGLINVRSGSNAIPANSALAADPSQPGCVMVAGSTGQIVGVAQQASSNGTIWAMLQGL